MLRIAVWIFKMIFLLRRRWTAIIMGTVQLDRWAIAIIENGLIAINVVVMPARLSGKRIYMAKVITCHDIRVAARAAHGRITGRWLGWWTAIVAWHIGKSRRLAQQRRKHNGKSKSLLHDALLL